MPENPKIEINREDKPSAYMVDLLALAIEKEAERQRAESERKLIDKGKDRLMGYLNKERGGKSKKINKQKSEYTEAKFGIRVEFEEEKKPALNERLATALKNNFIFQGFYTIYLGFRAVFVFAYNICYYTGWLALFVVRFVFYVTLFCLRPFKPLYEPVFALLKKTRSESVDLVFDEVEEKEDESLIDEAESREIEAILETKKQRIVEISAVQEKCTVNESQESPQVQEERVAENVNWNTALVPSYLKPLAAFAGMLILLVLPFKILSYYGVLKDLGGRVLGASEEAIGGLKGAGEAAQGADFFKAGEEFAAASDSFLKAQDEIEAISDELKLLAGIIPNDKLRLAADADRVLEAAAISAQIGEDLSFLLDSLTSDPEKKISSIYRRFARSVTPIRENLDRLDTVLAAIDVEAVPATQREDFIRLRERLASIRKGFIELEALLPRIGKLIAIDGEKRYMVIYQNNREMRASGGFMGSYSIVDFRDGDIVAIDTPKGGTYDMEGAFYERIVAPEPLWIVNPLWHFWDANWWPDWKKTASKLRWFYEHSGGSSVDGVIAMTPEVAERLLAIIGPLDMTATHGVVIDKDNFWELTQSFAEQKPKGHPDYHVLPFVPTEASTTPANDPGKEPKKIIGDLIGVIKTELPKRLDKEKFLALSGALLDSLDEKHILFSFDDAGLQNEFERLGWAGRMGKTAGDYLMVVDTNISGAKSDRHIVQEVQHSAEVQEDGRIIDTLRIVRKHEGVKGEKFSGVKNLDWLRVYVPLGAKLIEAKGFWPPDESLFEKPDPSWRHDPDLAASEENFIRDSISWTKTYNEEDKTVFANWVQVDPGMSVEVVIRYELPFRLLSGTGVESTYSLLIEKQPGAKESQYSSLLKLPASREPAYAYPSKLQVTDMGWNYRDVLKDESFLAISLR